MMIARYIAELTEGSRVAGAFMLRSREVRAARNGDAYLHAELADRTGSITAVLFRPTPAVTAVPAGTVVFVNGTVTCFRGTKRISIETLAPADTWDVTDLVPGSPRPIDEGIADLRELAGSIKEPGMRRLIRHIFGDKAFFDRFCLAPASQSYHHAYAGGLLAHTVAVAQTCMSLVPRYDGLDRDLLVAAALLHDIGKVDELVWDVGIAFSEEGRLVGHVVGGVIRIRDAATATRLPMDVRMRLEHAVISHHGELEWGAPKRPTTLEALLLHHVDNLDAKAACFSAAVKGAAVANESWSDADNLFRRPLYAPRAAEDDRHVRPSEDTAHFRRSA